MNPSDRYNDHWIEFPEEWATCDLGTCSCDLAAQAQCADFRVAFFIDVDEASTIGLEPELPDNWYIEADRERHFEECPSAVAAVSTCLCLEIVQAREETWRDFFTDLLKGTSLGVTLSVPPNHDAWCPIEQYGRGSCGCAVLKGVRIGQWKRLSEWRSSGRLGRLSDGEGRSGRDNRAPGGASPEAA